jgi:hypothetical protein
VELSRVGGAGVVKIPLHTRYTPYQRPLAHPPPPPDEEISKKCFKKGNEKMGKKVNGKMYLKAKKNK